MSQIRLPDHLYKEAHRKAADAGFASVDDYVADVVSHDLHEANEDFASLFTPERLAELDRISAEMKAGGKTFTMEEMQEHLEEKRKTWSPNHSC